MKEPRLNISFSYDHATGFYTAHLANGAKFAFDRKAVSGRLENALVLFARGVVALQSGGYVQKPETPPEFDYSYDEASVRRFKANGRAAPLTLPELELDLGDLEL